MADEELNTNKRPFEDSPESKEEDSGKNPFYKRHHQLDSFFFSCFIDDDIGPVLPPPPVEEAPKKKKRSKNKHCFKRHLLTFE